MRTGKQIISSQWAAFSSSFSILSLLCACKFSRKRNEGQTLKEPAHYFQKGGWSILMTGVLILSALRLVQPRQPAHYFQKGGWSILMKGV